jgi:hypothetical protein
MYDYRITRISPNNNVEAERILNEFGKDGYHIAAWASFSLDVVLVMEREAQVTKTSGRRQVTVQPPEE